MPFGHAPSGLSGAVDPVSAASPVRPDYGASPGLIPRCGVSDPGQSATDVDVLSGPSLALSSDGHLPREDLTRPGPCLPFLAPVFASASVPPANLGPDRPHPTRLIGWPAECDGAPSHPRQGTDSLETKIPMLHPSRVTPPFCPSP